MTICMLTPDIAIDRRIILEAKTLVEKGNEVLIISSMDAEKKLPEYEIQEGIKIRRFVFDGSDPRLMKVYYVINLSTNKCSSLINCGHRILGSLAAGRDRIANRVMTSVYKNYDRMAAQEKWRSFSRRLLSGAQVLMKGFMFVSSKAILWPGLMLNRMYTYYATGLEYIKRAATAGVRGLSGSTAYDIALFREASKYRYDVYHAHDLPSLKPAYLAARHHGSRLFYDAHELYPEIITLSPDAKRMYDRLERRYIGKADQVTTVNEFIAEEMGKRYRIRTPDVLLNCTNIPPNFDSRRTYDLIRRETGIAPDQLIVLFQGWFSPHRGLETLIKSARHLRQGIVIVFMGFGDYRNDLQNLAAENGVRDRVYFINAVTQDVLLQWTSSADVGIIPYQAIDLNTTYCSPNKLFEFIAAGLPILANDLPYLRQIISHHGIGQVHTLADPESYAAAINSICSDRDRLASIRRNTITASEIFNWDVEGRKLLALYERFEKKAARRA